MYRWCITEPCTWNPHMFINQHHPSTFIRRKMELAVSTGSHSISLKQMCHYLGWMQEENSLSPTVGVGWCLILWPCEIYEVTIKSMRPTEGCSYLYNLKHLTCGVSMPHDAINHHALSMPIDVIYWALQSDRVGGGGVECNWLQWKRAWEQQYGCFKKIIVY